MQVLNETIMEERALGLLSGLTLACNALRDMPEFLHRMAEGCVSSTDLEVDFDLRDTEIRKAMPGLVEYGRKHK